MHFTVDLNLEQLIHPSIAQHIFDTITNPLTLKLRYLAASVIESKPFTHLLIAQTIFNSSAKRQIPIHRSTDWCPFRTNNLTPSYQSRYISQHISRNIRHTNGT